MKLKFKTRKTISNVISILLVCLLGVGAVFGVSALSNKLKEDTKVIHPAFSVGGINAEGKGDKELNGSIYTKESFACKGLEVKLDFDANVKYQIFYYDELDNYISNSSIYDASSTISVPKDAVNARIVVIPVWDDDVKTEDRVCHWYNVLKYSSQLEISVLKEQEIVLPTFLQTIKDTSIQKAPAYLGQGTYDISNKKFESNLNADWYCFGTYDGTNYDECIIKVKNSAITQMSEFTPEYGLTRIYDVTNQKEIVTLDDISYVVLGEYSGFQYVSLDISSIGEFVITTDKASYNDFEIWFR